MRRALELAETARGRTNPNPMVGAVIVKNGEIVGEGWHHKAGTPHAEVHALKMAGEKAKDATLYVTLEPCSHYGKTPPCADAVVAAGLKRVVIAVLDSNPLVAGRGVEKLKAAGIEVKIGVCEEESRRMNEVFFKYIQTKTPFVLLKAATTLDGKIATAAGKSRWISNEESRRYVHVLRDEYDAILVGIGTVLKDDPLLNVRLEGKEGHDPVRVVLDSHLRIPLESQLVQTAKQQKTIVFCAPDADVEKKTALLAAGVDVAEVERDGGSLDVEAVLRELGQREICSLLLEGGGEVHAAFLKRKLVDKICWFIAPKLFGGKTAPGPIGGDGIEDVEDAVEIENLSYKWFGHDLCLLGYPTYGK